MRWSCQTDTVKIRQNWNIHEIQNKERHISSKTLGSKIWEAIFPIRICGRKMGNNILKHTDGNPIKFLYFWWSPSHPIPWADIYSITQYPINTDSPADWARALKSSAFLTWLQALHQNQATLLSASRAIEHKLVCQPINIKNQSWLVGGIPTPLKNMSSSVGMMTFPTEWKNKCSKPPTR